MRYGFTGTQRGMTAAQAAAVRDLLAVPVDGPVECHHGDCVGADAGFHDVAVDLGHRVVVHPPDDPAKRAWCAGDEIRAQAPYLVRNRAIVDAADVLLAAPDGAVEKVRSGTWSTVRYARRTGTPVVLVLPDGSVVRERPV